MTIPCSKEADIATTKADMTWVKNAIIRIEGNVEKLVNRAAANDLKWAKLSVLGMVGGVVGSAVYEFITKHWGG